MQDHFSKYIVAYVVKDQTACTAAETLRNGYFGLFGAPAYLVSDQGKAFTGHLITNLCELYGVQKLRTSPYHAQTNGQVEWMNQTIIHMIGKVEQEKKAHWSEHLPEMLSAYNGTRSAVTGYSPYFLLFGRKARMPVAICSPLCVIHPIRLKWKCLLQPCRRGCRKPLQYQGTSPLRKLPNNGAIMIARLEVLPYSLETLLWFILMALWASRR